MRESVAAISLATSAVPSGELSSTTMSSQSMSGSAARKVSMRRGDVLPLVEGWHHDAELGCRGAAAPMAAGRRCGSTALTPCVDPSRMGIEAGWVLRNGLADGPVAAGA